MTPQSLLNVSPVRRSSLSFKNKPHFSKSGSPTFNRSILGSKKYMSEQIPARMMVIPAIDLSGQEGEPKKRFSFSLSPRSNSSTPRNRRSRSSKERDYVISKIASFCGSENVSQLGEELANVYREMVSHEQSLKNSYEELSMEVLI